MSEEQGVTAEAVEAVEVDTTTQGSNAEHEATNKAETQEATAEVEVEEVEVDYKEKSEKLQRDVDGRQGKIDKQRAALSAANKQREALQSELAKLQVNEAPKEPVIDDYDTHDEWVEAVSTHKAKDRFEQYKRDDIIKQQQDLATKTSQEQAETFAKVEAEYRVSNPDYDRAKSELQSHLELNPVNNAVGDAIYEQASRDGGLAQIIDYFGSESGENLGEWDRISTLSPVEAGVEIYKIQQGLKNVVTPKEKPLPKPIKGVKGTSKASKGLDHSSGKDILKWVNS